MAVGQKAYKAALEKLDTYVRETGLRESPLRKVVLDKMCTLPQPFSAEQLVQACENEHVSQGTIYNALKLFLKIHIVNSFVRHQGQASTEYEVVTGASSRIQIICLKCGRKAETHDDVIAKMVREKQYYNFNVRRFSLFVYGECKICRRLAKKQKAKTK